MLAGPTRMRAADAIAAAADAGSMALGKLFDKVVAAADKAALARVLDAVSASESASTNAVLPAVAALLTAAEAAVQDEKFAQFRKLANARGNPENGKQLFTALCLSCHQFAGQGEGQTAGLFNVDMLHLPLLAPGDVGG